MKWFLMLVLCCGCLICGSAIAADDDAPVAAAAPVGAAEASAARADELFGAGSLSWRERRRMGLTIPKIATTLKQLKAEGEIEQGMSQSEIAVAVLDRLSAEDPKMYADVSLDIEGILAFIERLLPLIMTILGIFL